MDRGFDRRPRAPSGEKRQERRAGSADRGPGTLRVSCTGVGETHTADRKQGRTTPAPGCGASAFPVGAFTGIVTGSALPTSPKTPASQPGPGSQRGWSVSWSAFGPHQAPRGEAVPLHGSRPLVGGRLLADRPGVWRAAASRQESVSVTLVWRVTDPCVMRDCVFCSFSGHHWTFRPDRSPGPSRLAGVYLGGVCGPVPFWGEQEAGEPGPWASVQQDDDRMAGSPGLGPAPSGRGAQGGFARPLHVRAPSDGSREGGSLGLTGFRQGRRAFQKT